MMCNVFMVEVSELIFKYDIFDIDINVDIVN